MLLVMFSAFWANNKNNNVFAGIINSVAENYIMHVTPKQSAWKCTHSLFVHKLFREKKNQSAMAVGLSRHLIRRHKWKDAFFILSPVQTLVEPWKKQTTILMDLHRPGGSFQPESYRERSRWPALPTYSLHTGLQNKTQPTSPCFFSFFWMHL